MVHRGKGMWQCITLVSPHVGTDSLLAVTVKWFSDQSGSRLTEYLHMVDQDQQMGTAPGSPHHPTGGAADP